MKVLFVCSGNNKNFDVVPFIKEQAKSLAPLGIQVDYFPVIGKGMLGYIKAGLKLRAYLKTKQYDLIHAHFTLSGWAAVIGAGQTPVVLSLMGSDAYGEYIGVNKVQTRSRLNTLLTYLIQPFTKAIISKSGNIAQYVYQRHKSFIIPNGIDRAKFRPNPAVTKHSLGLNPSKRQVLFLGSNTNVRKNFALVQAAFNRLNLPDTELINPYPVAHTLIPDYLNVVDVLVVPSLMEGSPNVVKEAMACNCPIVATDVGDVAWVLGDTPGCYVAAFDAEDFARKLELALAFAAENGRTTGEARIAKLGLDAGTVAGRVREVYEMALNKSAVREQVVAPA